MFVETCEGILTGGLLEIGGNGGGFFDRTSPGGTKRGETFLAGEGSNDPAPYPASNNVIPPLVAGGSLTRRAIAAPLIERGGGGEGFIDRPTGTAVATSARNYEHYQLHSNCATRWCQVSDHFEGECGRNLKHICTIRWALLTSFARFVFSGRLFNVWPPSNLFKSIFCAMPCF